MIFEIRQDDAEYPGILRKRMGARAPLSLFAEGKVELLSAPLLGMICSIRCPGSVVLKTFDTARALRDSGTVLIGGFHSPMERECLDILLRGSQPVVLCLAKGIKGARLGGEARRAIQEGRLLLLSPFDAHTRRTTALHAVVRNTLVAALARVLWMPYAAPGGKTWETVLAAISWRLPIFTFEDEANRDLVALVSKSGTKATAPLENALLPSPVQPGMKGAFEVLDTRRERVESESDD